MPRHDNVLNNTIFSNSTNNNNNNNINNKSFDFFNGMNITNNASNVSANKNINSSNGTNNSLPNSGRHFLQPKLPAVSSTTSTSVGQNQMSMLSLQNLYTHTPTPSEVSSLLTGRSIHSPAHTLALTPVHTPRPDKHVFLEPAAPVKHADWQHYKPLPSGASSSMDAVSDNDSVAVPGSATTSHNYCSSTLSLPYPSGGVDTSPFPSRFNSPRHSASIHAPRASQKRALSISPSLSDGIDVAHIIRLSPTCLGPYLASRNSSTSGSPQPGHQGSFSHLSARNSSPFSSQNSGQPHRRVGAGFTPLGIKSEGMDIYMGPGEQNVAPAHGLDDILSNAYVARQSEMPFIEYNCAAGRFPNDAGMLGSGIDNNQGYAGTTGELMPSCMLAGPGSNGISSNGNISSLNNSHTISNNSNMGGLANNTSTMMNMNGIPPPPSYNEALEQQQQHHSQNHQQQNFHSQLFVPKQMQHSHSHPHLHQHHHHQQQQQQHQQQHHQQQHHAIHQHSMVHHPQQQQQLHLNSLTVAVQHQHQNFHHHHQQQHHQNHQVQHQQLPQQRHQHGSKQQQQQQVQQQQQQQQQMSPAGGMGASLQQVLSPNSGMQQLGLSPGPAASDASGLEAELEEDETTVCGWMDCGLTFSGQEELVRHLEKAHIDQRKGDEFTCFWQGCPRRFRPFNARYKLLIHMRVHSGEKPNKCTVSFSYLSCIAGRES